MEKRIYFDWAASSPFNGMGNISPSLYGNPSSQHSEGRAARKALEDSRERIAGVLGVSPDTLAFTSGGTESNSIALLSTLLRPGKGRIISSLAEHASIREAMLTLEKSVKPTGNITVDSSGKVTPDTLKNALDKYGDVRFASAMHVNNETGAVTDIASLCAVIQNYTQKSKTSPIHFHCDLVQSTGKIPVSLSEWGIDSASISAHKIGGPKGIGLLYLKKPIDVFYRGGGQENGVRGGTENTMGAAAFADVICDEKSGIKNIDDNLIKAKERWQRLIDALSSMDRCVLIPKDRKADDNSFSPFILQAAFKGIPGEVMARALDDLGFAVSTGSACASSSPERPVLIAMGVEENLRIEGIRISQGYCTTNEDIDALINGIGEVLKFL